MRCSHCNKKCDTDEITLFKSDMYMGRITKRISTNYFCTETCQKTWGVREYSPGLIAAIKYETEYINEQKATYIDCLKNPDQNEGCELFVSHYIHHMNVIAFNKALLRHASREELELRRFKILQRLGEDLEIAMTTHDDEHTNIMVNLIKFYDEEMGLVEVFCNN